MSQNSLRPELVKSKTRQKNWLQDLLSIKELIKTRNQDKNPVKFQELAKNFIRQELIKNSSRQKLTKTRTRQDRNAQELPKNYSLVSAILKTSSNFLNVGGRQ